MACITSLFVPPSIAATHLLDLYNQSQKKAAKSATKANDENVKLKRQIGIEAAFTNKLQVSVIFG